MKAWDNIYRKKMVIIWATPGQGYFIPNKLSRQADDDDEQIDEE